MLWKNKITLSQQGKAGCIIWVQSCSIKQSWLQHDIHGSLYLQSSLFMQVLLDMVQHKLLQLFCERNFQKHSVQAFTSRLRNREPLNEITNTIFPNALLRFLSVSGIQYRKLYWEGLQSSEFILFLSNPKESCEGKFIPCLRLHLVRVHGMKPVCPFHFQQFIRTCLANIDNFVHLLVLQW